MPHSNGKLVWLTGLAGSGKTTIGREVYKNLKNGDDNVVFLDGDGIREIFGNDLGHDPEDRLKNAWRIAKLCRFLVEQGLVVVCSTMSLYKEIHEYNRELDGRYFEVYIHAPLEELVRRDQKGLYSRALKGEINHVVGVDLPFDKPAQNHIEIDNTELNRLEDKAEKILAMIWEKNKAV